MKLKIALVQFEVKLNQSFNKTSKRIISYIRQAKAKHCQIICFPEDFWFGPLDCYSLKERTEITGLIKIKILDWIKKQAKQYKINIIAGTLIEKINQGYFNTCYFINDKGIVVANYKKRKLVPYGFEGSGIKAGNRQFTVVVINGIKVGVIICRELFYPDICYQLKKQGAELIICLSFWPKNSSDYLKNKLHNDYHIVSAMRVVDALCQARSFENELCFCFVYAAGRLIKAKEFDVLLGRTQVCLPFLGCIKKLPQNKKGMIIFSYDKTIIADARKSYKL